MLDSRSTRPSVREADGGEVTVLLVRHQRGPQLGGRLGGGRGGGRAQPRGPGESAHARGPGESAHARGGVAAPACAGEMVTILGVIVRTKFNQPSNKIPRTNKIFQILCDSLDMMLPRIFTKSV